MLVSTVPGMIDFEQYLRDERSREIRHEYVAGYVYAMAGASKQHNRIALNLAFAARQQLRGSQCQIYSENVLVKINWLGKPVSYYPDMMVCCDPEDTADEYYCERPCIIVEVLSDSTARADRNEKLRAYLQIPSLQTYLIVSQQAMHVAAYLRRDGWEPRILSACGDRLSLECGADHSPIELTLAQIYESVF